MLTNILYLRIDIYIYIYIFMGWYKLDIIILFKNICLYCIVKYFARLIEDQAEN
jgi:hypothetical protein